LTTALAVTLTTGTKALIIFGANVNNNGSEIPSYMSVAVSGATTLASSDNYSLQLFTSSSNRPKFGASRAVLLTGLTAGSNTFSTQYKTGSSGTAGFEQRNIMVVDMGS